MKVKKTKLAAMNVIPAAVLIVTFLNQAHVLPLTFYYEEDVLFFCLT